MIIQDSELGELRYDLVMDWYEVQVPTRYGVVSVGLDCDEYPSIAELVSDIRGFCRDLESTLEKAYTDIAKTMVPIKNEVWLDENEMPISDEKLLQAVQSKDISISLFEGGCAEMFFYDGGFFGGHSIVVLHGEDGTVGGAHLAG